DDIDDIYQQLSLCHQKRVLERFNLQAPGLTQIERAGEIIDWEPANTSRQIFTHLQQRRERFVGTIRNAGRHSEIDQCRRHIPASAWLGRDSADVFIGRSGEVELTIDIEQLAASIS